MIFNTVGNKSDPAILFFHAMGVTGESSQPVSDYLKEHYYCIMPTSTVYCKDQKYLGKTNELQQLEGFLHSQGIKKITFVVASSLGADLAMTFLTRSVFPIEHVFFDGGQFAQIPAPLRAIMTPFVYLAIKSLYWSKGKTLKKILWCDDKKIQPYFIKAGKYITYGNLRRQLKCSLENKPFPELPESLQQNTFWEFGSIEEHFQYRPSVMKSYPQGNFPVFENYNHMQYQIRDPKGFAEMLLYIISNNKMPPLSFLAE